MYEQIEICRLTTVRVESNRRLGFRRPVIQGTKVHVAGEELKDFGGKASWTEFGPCPRSLFRASTVLPLDVPLGTCETVPSLEVFNDLASFRDHAGVSGRGDRATICVRDRMRRFSLIGAFGRSRPRTLTRHP